MRPRNNLVLLSVRACVRLARLQYLTRLVVDGKAQREERERLVAYVVIEALNLWANFSRSFLLSLLTRPRRRGGGRVTLRNPTIVTPGDLLYTAAIAAKGIGAAAPRTRRDEPAWHDKNVLLRTCQRIDPTNLQEVQGALSIQSRVFDDLPAFRNFYAHRNEDTAETAVKLVSRMYSVALAAHPTDALLSFAPRRSQCILSDWLDDLAAVTELMAE